MRTVQPVLDDLDPEWEEAELINRSRPSVSTEEKANQIKLLLDRYVSFSLQPTDPTFSDFSKAKVLGEVLFALAYLAGVDNINVFTALQSTVNIAKIPLDILSEKSNE